MKIEILTSRSGLPFAVIDGKRIHSAYDPRMEAERFLEQKYPDEAPVYIIAGPGLCYLNSAIEKRKSNSRIISIFFHDIFFERYDKKIGLEWYPSSPEPLESFLSRILSDHDLEGLSYIEWNPSFLCDPETGSFVSRTVRSVLRVLNGNIATASAFGRIWWRNSIINSIRMGTIVSTPSDAGSFPIVIAASGPTLNEDIAQLRLFRNRFVLIALSSALRTLGYHDIRPDMIVTTDPGGYAGFHLDLSGFMDIPVAMPLTGCRGVWKWNSPVLVINQGSLPERTFVESLSIPAIDIPQNGTVAGTALILSRRLTSGPIVLAGLDMAELDTQTHSRPHAFDFFSIDLTNRINPAHSSSFINSRKRTTEVPGGHGWRTSLPLSTYASWFGSVGRGSVDRNGVFRLNPSPIAMEGLPTVTGSGLAELFPESAVSFPVSFEGNPSLSEIGDRQAIVLDLLDRLISILRSVLDGEEPGPAFFNQGNSNYFELVWTLETRNVLEYKKFLRKGTCGESRSVWERTIRSCIDFFSTNRERLAHVKH